MIVPDKELEMGEQPDMTAYDALRLAVDYHSQTRQGGGMQEQRDWVLRTAEQFYEWLRSKQVNR